MSGIRVAVVELKYLKREICRIDLGAHMEERQESIRPQYECVHKDWQVYIARWEELFKRAAVKSSQAWAIGDP